MDQETHQTQVTTASTGRNVESDEATSAGQRHRLDPRDWVPELGYENYWQPAIESRRLRRKPRRVKILGHEMAVFRTSEGPKAVGNICPHRGARLSDGACRFDGTVSCPYHGWTFNGDGECVAALTDGPTSPIPRQVSVRSYPTAEALGMVWVFVGEESAPPLLEDLPKTMSAAATGGHSVNVFRFRQDWQANWRVTMDNSIDAAHAFYLHRPSLWILFSSIPAFIRIKMVAPDWEDPDRFIGYTITESEVQGEFPGVGTYPRRIWWRRKKQNFSGENAIGLPGVFILRNPAWTHIRWAVPIDEKVTRNYMWAIRKGGPIRRAMFTINFWTWLRWIFYYNFSAQDKWLTETVQYENLDKERLAATDVPVQAWRRLSENAR